MKTMREISTTTPRDHERNLDALLEDLQTSVSRSNSSANINGVTSGYRSVRTTKSDGTPEGTSTEYHVEYLNPANSTHHVTESSYNGGGGHRSKNVSYKYETERSSASDGRLKKNINELDSLLEDLNSAQRKGFSENSMSSRNYSGIDSGLLEPVTSTPRSSRSVAKHYREEKTVRGRSSSPMRDLVFTGSRDPSPVQHQTLYEQQEQSPTVQQYYRYEKTTSTRTTAPVITDITPVDGTRMYNYNEETTPLAIGMRSPSPTGHYYTSTVKEISPSIAEKVSQYSKDSDFQTSKYPGQPTKQTNMYSYSSSSSTVREVKNEAPKTPPPHRSPSPVSFNQPPTPKKIDIHPRSPSPTFNTPHTVSSYKYSSSTTSNGYDNKPRPFPVNGRHTPEEQQPPKQLDELLASLSETDTRQYRYNESSNVRHYSSNKDHRHQPPVTPPIEKQKEIVRSIEKEKIIEKEDSKNISGPPVYYPPGELFAKKEESMMQQQSGGGKYKAKAKYEYESKSKSKSKESSGKAVVPVCLPVCCAMPCSIM